MADKNSGITGAILLIVIGLFAFAIYYSNSLMKSSANLLDKIRNENKGAFDSLQTAITNENKLNDRIVNSINAGEFRTAYALMDSLPSFGKTLSIHLYEGMICEKQNKYAEAIEKYSEAINEDPFSKGGSMRANVYMKIGKPELALSDYKRIYAFNHYFSYHVANTYLFMHKKDSALKYFKIYLQYYPNDSIVMQKAEEIESK